MALAHLIMGDGTYYKGKGISICTDSYSMVEVVQLINVLIIRYSLKCTIHKHREGQYRIHISTKSVESLRNVVLPYFIPSMFYKLGL